MKDEGTGGTGGSAGTGGSGDGGPDHDGVVANGCEYECEPLRDRNGVPVTEEAVCDGKDDDCNKLIEEVFDLDTDLANCGGCNHACTPPANTVMKCAAGHCEFDRCILDYEDANHDITAKSIDNGTTDGCECNVIGLELCNYVDDDCDGEVDEGVDAGLDAGDGMARHIHAHRHLAECRSVRGKADLPVARPATGRSPQRKTNREDGRTGGKSCATE